MNSLAFFQPTGGLIRREMNRVFDDFLGSFPRAVWSEYSDTSSRSATNIWEANSKLFLEMELPGVSIDEVEISLEKGTLTIGSKLFEQEPREASGVLRRERKPVVFKRVFTLPFEVDADAVEAQLRNGVLTVTLPKAPSVQPRKIQVSTVS